MLFGAVGTLISFVIISLGKKKSHSTPKFLSLVSYILMIFPDLFLFWLGAKHFFEKMNIGDLTISDYLGTLKKIKPKTLFKFLFSKCHTV